MRTLVTVLAAMLYGSAFAAECSTANIESCNSCDKLTIAASTFPIAVLQQGAQDYINYRSGTLYNGLFLAYKKNCSTAAEVMLKRGVHPGYGGTESSMPITVSSGWPQKSKAISLKWAELLTRYGANMDNGPGSNTSRDIAAESPYLIKYPDVWMMFDNSQR